MRLAILAILLLSTTVHAQSPEREDRWPDYTRSMSSKKLWGWEPTTTATESVYFENADDTKLVLRWGMQIEVTCRGGQADDFVMFCFTMDGAFEYGHQPSMGAGFDCNDGDCGYFSDSSGPSGVAGPMPCFVVGSGATKYRRVAKGIFTTGGVAPTYRTGRCVGVGVLVSGAPCSTNGECGSGTCVTDSLGAQGTYLSGQATDSAMSCQLEFGI